MPQISRTSPQSGSTTASRAHLRLGVNIDHVATVRNARGGPHPDPVHAGHGLTFNTVEAIARLPEVVELNIGHFLVGEAIFTGLDPAIRHMRALMDQARGTAP